MRVALSLHLASVLLVGVVIAGCDHKERVVLNEAADGWRQASARMRSQAEELRGRQRDVADRIGKLAVPAGTEDVTLANAIVELQNGLGPVEAALARVDDAIAQGAASVSSALADKDKRTAERAVAAAQQNFDVAADSANAALAPLEPKVNAAESIIDRLLAGIEAEINQLRRLSQAGGNVDFSAIDFKAGSAEFDFTRPASKATLDRLVQFAASCRQLRFGITGHTSKEGQAAQNKTLSQARADAVRGYLVQQGIEADKIVRTAGAGSTKTIVDEPEPGTAAEAALDPAALEALRRRNRRVNIDVVTSCAAPAPAAAEAPQPPSAPTGTITPTVELVPAPTRAPAVRGGGAVLPGH